MMSKTICICLITIGILVAITPITAFGQTTEKELLRRQLNLEQEQLNLMKYQMQKRSPFIAAGLSLTLPFGLGHAYGLKGMDGWLRGLAFFGTEVGLTIGGSILASDYGTKETIGEIMILVSPLVKIAETVDSYLQAKDYNRRLRRGYRLYISFEKGQGQIQLCCSF